MEWLAQVEQWAGVAALRDSTWVYPLVNSGHILGIGLLIGAILPLDLRLLGLWGDAPLAPLWRVLTRSAACGLALAVLCGLALFATDARAYLGSPWFLGKLALIALGLANAALLRWPGAAPPGGERAPPRLRAAAALSIACWCGALLLGRLVGYF